MKHTPLLAALLLPAALFAADTNKVAWAEPPVAEPKYDGASVPPPPGAITLFDGQDVSKWRQEAKPKQPPSADDAAKWKVEGGYLEVVPKTGMLVTREAVITSGHLHLEWATPAEVKGSGQGRGNSGVFIEGFPEVQVLDSFGNKTYFDGQAAALYKHRPPLVNACRGPGLWQCYDIHVARAKVEGGKVVQPATITVYHNNVLVQDKVPFANPAQKGTLKFQDHGNPVRYRNVWFKPSP